MSRIFSLIIVKLQEWYDHMFVTQTIIIIIIMFYI